MPTPLAKTSGIVFQVMPPPPTPGVGEWTLTPSATGNFFETTSGTRLYFTGSQGWMDGLDLIRDTLPNTPPGPSYPPTPFAFSASEGSPNYLDWAEAQNYTYIRYWLSDQSYGSFSGGTVSWAYSPVPYARPGPALAADGLPKYDLNTWNQSYFDRIRTRCLAAAAKNMYVGIILYFFFSGTTGWTYHPFRGANNIQAFDADPDATGTADSMYTLNANQAATLVRQKAFVTKVIDTVNDLNNVLFEIGNEVPPTSKLWQYEIINHIHNYEATQTKRHRVGMSAGGGVWTDTDLTASPADWIAPQNFSAGSLWPDTWQAPPEYSAALSGNKVMILDVDHLFPDNDDPVQVDDGQWFWKAFTKGFHAIHMDDLFDLSIAGTQDTTWAQIYYPYRTTQKQTSEYAARIDLALTVPNSALSSTGYCMANPGTQYLVLQPATAGGAFTVDLSAGGGSNFSVEWLDIGADSVSFGANVAGGSAAQSFTPPVASTVVLFLNNIGASGGGDALATLTGDPLATLSGDPLTTL